MFKRNSIEDVVHPRHDIPHRLGVTYITYIFLRGLQMLRLEFVAYVVLLFLVPGEDADLANVGTKEVLEYGRNEGPDTDGNHEGSIRKRTLM